MIKNSSTARYHLFQYDLFSSIFVICHSERKRRILLTKEICFVPQHDSNNFIYLWYIIYLLNILAPVIGN